MRRIFSTALFALGMAGLLRAADTAPAAPSAAPEQATPSASAPTSAPASPASAPAAASAIGAAPQADSAKAKAATAPAPAPAKKLSKKAKAAGTRPAAADSIARADSLKAVATADSLKAAQAKADSARAAEMRAAAVADSLRADSARQARAKASADSARTAAADSAAADSAASKSKKRKRIVRETTVNTIDELKGRYRSPKKAMFMSLVVPGLGQAYVGHSWFNYARGAAYFLGDVALAYGWHYYVGVKQDREISKYQAFADENWRQWKYEDSVLAHKEKSKDLNQHRESYCDAVQSRASNRGELLHGGCLDPDKSSEYESFKNEYKDTGTAAEVGVIRADFPNPQQFYEMIGKENEFITGWLDAPAMKGDSAWYAVNDSGNVVLDAAGRQVLASTPYQQRYIGMRAQANDYARMQAWFLGGMVVNHIVSAVDAALTARYHNKALYQSETYWYDRIHLDSRVAWEGLAPVPTVTASFTF